MKKYIVIILVIGIIGGIFLNYRLKETKTSFLQLDQDDFVVPDTSSFKIMTYNIQHGGKGNKSNIDKIADLISNSGAWIVGLNEVDDTMARSNFQKQYQKLGEKLQMDYAFAPAVTKVFSKYGNALLTTFPIQKVKNHSLPVEADDEPRSLLEAKLMLTSDKEVTVMVTHLSAEKKNREKQIKWIEDFIDSKETPFILMGDFNSTRIGSIAGFKSISQNLKTYPSSSPSFAIDKIFSNIDNLNKPEVINVKLSDHLPLVAEFKL